MNTYHKRITHFPYWILKTTAAGTSEMYVPIYQTRQCIPEKRSLHIYRLENIKSGEMIWYMIYLLTAIGLSPGGSSTVHIYTQTIYRTKQNKKYIEQHKIWEECGPFPVFAIYTLPFALQLREKHGKTSKEVRKNPNRCIPLKLHRQF